MKRIVSLSIIALGAALSAMPAYAQFPNSVQFGNGQYNNSQFYNGQFNNRWNNDGRIDVVQSRLQARINQGISDGRLSPSEASRLRAKLSRIDSIEARMRASGGRLSFNERNKLSKQLDVLSMQITRDLNDFERRRLGYFNNRFWR